MSPPATDIPINCITLLFRLHLFGNLTSKSTFLSQRDCARVQVSLNIHICSVLPGVPSWRWSRAAAKWAAAGRDRKPGVKDILRSEITPRCWEHEQAVRVSFTLHGSSQCNACCRIRGKKAQTTSAPLLSSFSLLTIVAANAVGAGLPGTRTSRGRRHLARGGRLVAVRPISGRPNSPCNNTSTVKYGAMTLLKGSFNNYATASLGR